MLMRPFTAPYFLLLALVAAVTMLFCHALRGCAQERREQMLLALCLFNLVFYFVYKGLLSLDGEFVRISGLERFNWFNELPLQLCNINLFLLPIGILRKNRKLLGFAFFIAPFGALLALTFPNAPFNGFSVLLPRMIGFYGTHALLIVCALCLPALGLYRPERRDFRGVLVTFFALALCAHGVNLLLRATVCPQANYFFTFCEDNAILELFWRIVPVPFLYLLPVLPILWGYMALVTRAVDRLCGGELPVDKSAKAGIMN